MIIEELTVTAFQQHTRLVGCSRTMRAVCIDPGGETELIVQALERNRLRLQAITLTHAHMDHIGGVAELKRNYPDVPVILHKADEPLYNGLSEQPAMLGIPRASWEAFGFAYEQPPQVSRYWVDGELYQVGELSFEIIHCPGHTPGHIVMFERFERKVFVGDCLFAGSIGRTDLPGGSTEQLLDSILTRIIPLGDDVTVYSGHGPVTTIGAERRSNPFVTGAKRSAGSRL